MEAILVASSLAFEIGPDRHEFRDDLLDGLGCVDLMRTGRANAGSSVGEDEVALRGSLAVVVRRPTLDSAEQHMGRSG